MEAEHQDAELPQRIRANSVDDWFPRLHSALRELAAQAMRREARHVTLQPTALVNEAYLRLRGGPGEGFATRAEFLAAAATVVRQVLVDEARRRRALKRGALRSVAVLAEELPDSIRPDLDLLALHEALSALAADYPRVARVVELRFFSGAAMQEIAALLGLSERSVKREWAFGRAWLGRALAQGS